MTNRPISPHLQVYKPQLTSVLSILHRITGVVLSLGIPLFLYWLWSLEHGADSYVSAMQFFDSLIGRICLFFWSFAFYYHLCNGIRHLFWDIGMGFELAQVYRSGWLVVAMSFVLTLLTWAAT